MACFDRAENDDFMNDFVGENKEDLIAGFIDKYNRLWVVYINDELDNFLEVKKEREVLN
jgi:hypothetical protein